MNPQHYQKCLEESAFQGKQREEFKEKFQNYQNHLSLIKLKDEFLDPSNKSITFFQRIQIVTYIILGFPIYLYGIINNLIPSIN